MTNRKYFTKNYWILAHNGLFHVFVFLSMCTYQLSVGLTCWLSNSNHPNFDSGFACFFHCSYNEFIHKKHVEAKNHQGPNSIYDEAYTFRTELPYNKVEAAVFFMTIRKKSNNEIQEALVQKWWGLRYAHVAHQRFLKITRNFPNILGIFKDFSSLASLKTQKSRSDMTVSFSINSQVQLVRKWGRKVS